LCDEEKEEGWRRGILARRRVRREKMARFAKTERFRMATREAGRARNKDLGR
jgi:hypothetical protein